MSASRSIRQASLTGLVREDLRRVLMLHNLFGGGVATKWRCFATDTEWWIGATLPATGAARADVLSRLSNWMMLNRIVTFTMTRLENEPAMLVGFGVSQIRTICATVAIVPGEPNRLGKIRWQDADGIEPDITGLLPREQRALSLDQQLKLDVMFGCGGEFQAIELSKT